MRGLIVGSLGKSQAQPGQGFFGTPVTILPFLDGGNGLGIIQLVEGLAEFWIIECILVQRQQLEGNFISLLTGDATAGCGNAYFALPAGFKAGVVIDNVSTCATHPMLLITTYRPNNGMASHLVKVLDRPSPIDAEGSSVHTMCELRAIAWPVMASTYIPHGSELLVHLMWVMLR